MSASLHLLYNLALGLAGAVAAPLVVGACLGIEKRRRTFAPRMGLGRLPEALPRPRKPVWVHALSVGEVRVAQALVRALDLHGHPVVVSASTITGSATAERLLGDRVGGICPFPYDVPWAVRRMAGRVDPGLCVLVETDLWPNFLFEMQRRQVPVVLANARLSPRTFAGYSRFSFFMTPVLGILSAVGAQSPCQAERFARLGVSPERIHVTGNLKFDQRVESLSAQGRQCLRQALGVPRGARILVAGSTHGGEEELVLEYAHRHKGAAQALFCIVAPRDPTRAVAVRRLFARQGFATGLFPSGQIPGQPPPEVVVVDALGVLGQLYGLADLCFVGGSMVPQGGHNPLEPAAHARPVVFGPHMEDFPEVARMFVERGAAVQVGSEGELFSAFDSILADGCNATVMGEKGMDLILHNRGAVEKTMCLLERFLP